MSPRRVSSFKQPRLAVFPESVACGVMARSQECSKGFEDLGLGTWVSGHAQWAVVLSGPC